MSNIAYVRVSTKEQNEARQREALKNHNIDKWFIEKKSGKNTDRPKFKEMLEYVRADDTIYILDFSRLSRSTADLLNIIDELKNRNVNLISLKESLDTNTANGKLMLTMLAAINEFERTNLLERQREGIEIAKRQGKYKGRKPIEKPKNWDEIFSMYITKELTATEAMRHLNLKKDMFYKFANTHNFIELIAKRPSKSFRENFSRAYI